MSKRSDRKLRQIPVASYNYRHEAEFAAGFLDEAGIPYRLQIEDPTLGLSATNSATLWVAAVDERRARRVLEHEATAADMDETRDGGVADEDDVARVGTRRSLPADIHGNVRPDLTLRERVLALFGSVGLGATLGVEAVRETAGWIPLVIALLAVSLTLMAVFGWAPGPLKRLLSALSGDAS